MRDDQVYLRHILEAIDSVGEYTTGGREMFFAQKIIQGAVIRNLEIIDEAVKNFSVALRQRSPDTLWQQIAGLRDVLIQQYFGVDLNLVWKVVDQRLPEVREQIVRLLCAGS